MHFSPLLRPYTLHQLVYLRTMEVIGRTPVKTGAAAAGYQV